MMVSLFGMVLVIIMQVDFGSKSPLKPGEVKQPTAMETAMPFVSVFMIGIFLYTMRTMVLRWRDIASELVVYED